MSADIPKHELLLKLLKMTASDNDGEALTAIRKATALLAFAGWDWDRLLAGKITIVGDPFGNLQRPAPQAAPYQPREAPRPPQAPPQRPTTPRQESFEAQRARVQANMQQSRGRAKRQTVNYADIFGSN